MEYRAEGILETDIGVLERNLKSSAKAVKFERCPEEGCNEIRNKKSDMEVHIRRDHLGKQPALIF